MMSKKRGFTLIELLVVIAIIGILSSIVLVALRSARNQAKDARIISSMSQIRSMAEVLYSGASYSDLACGADGAVTVAECTSACPSSVSDLCADIYVQNSSASMIMYSGVEYCVQVNLLNGGSFCIDSTGYAGKAATQYCDATFDCESD